MSDVDSLRNYARTSDVTTPAGNTPHEPHRINLASGMRGQKDIPAYHSVNWPIKIA
jgi:hypothetical protein